MDSTLVDDMTKADQATAADVGERGRQLPPEDLQLLLNEKAAGLAHSTALVFKKVDVLQGVSDQACNVLKERMSIETVLDLATSVVFGHASLVHRAADNPQELYAAAGAVPLDFLNDGFEDLDRRPEALIKQDIKVLRGIPPPSQANLLQQVKAALGVSTVRDLALYPPYIAALVILDQVHPVSDAEAPPDPEEPPELLPKVGIFSTEKVSFQRVFVDQFTAMPGQLNDIAPEPTAPDDSSKNLPAAFEAKSGINMNVLAQLDKPVLGAAVTMQQEWFQEGVALGTLLYSVALAPGESTRIAVTESSSSTKTSSTETMSQTEQSDTSTSANRSIHDVVKSMQDTRSVSTQTQESRAVGGSASGEASYHGFGFHASASFYASSNNNKVTSNVGMAGQTNMAASAVSDAVDSTHQAAVSSRNQRAAMVTEVTQEQSKTTTSRVLANYNRMHALTVQYYEVVQIYRVTTSVAKVQPLIFVPMRPITDWTDDILNQYSPILAAAAPTPAIRQLFTSYSLPQDIAMISQIAPPAVKPPSGMARDLERTLGELAKGGHTGVTDGPGQPWYLPVVSGAEKQGKTLIRAVRLSPVLGRDMCPIVSLKLVTWVPETPAKEGDTVETEGTLVTKGDKTTLADSFAITLAAGKMPIEQVAAVEVCTLNVDVDFRLDIDLQITWPGASTDAPAAASTDAPAAAPITTYTTYFKNAYDSSIADADAAAQRNTDQLRTLVGTLDGQPSTKDKLLKLIDNAGDSGAAGMSTTLAAAPTPARLAPFVAVEFQLVKASENPPVSALQELKRDSLRYNQAIWAGMDPTVLSLHLASYSYNGAPLFGQIEPEPVAVMGNLVGFVMRGDEDMQFGGPDRQDLWTYVAEDLSLAQFAEQGRYKQAIDKRSAAAREIAPPIKDLRSALSTAINAAATAPSTQDSGGPGSAATKLVFQNLMALKRAAKFQTRAAQQAAQLDAIAADLLKDYNAEASIIMEDAKNLLNSPEITYAIVDTDGKAQPVSGGEKAADKGMDKEVPAGSRQATDASVDKTAPDVKIASMAASVLPDSTLLKGTWGAWKSARGLDSKLSQTTTVALPTGGVFAEAVRGRFNAAEKKDYYRFTDWYKYRTSAAMATNFGAQRSDGLLQNSAAPTATGFDASSLIKGKSFDFTDIMNLADQAGVAAPVFNQLLGGIGGMYGGGMGNNGMYGGMNGGMGYGNGMGNNSMYGGMNGGMGYGNGMGFGDGMGTGYGNGLSGVGKGGGMMPGEQASGGGLPGLGGGGGGALAAIEEDPELLALAV
ncbi:hypothetical protein WJX75_008464 [Coccomyxa subellipsoidea]|uniref:Uncharacterized protein n=1 Tax=Coccomyxa subellipsoidea TaxID=248742 RepID=A0ABR2YW31_9CHLO